MKIKKLFFRDRKQKDRTNAALPTCSVLIAAYNEEEIIRQKIVNTLSLNYPPNLLRIFVIADGSTDKTTEIVSDFKQVSLLFTQSRKGKVHAINRAMQFVDTDIVVFTDANTFLNKDALIKIGAHYEDPKIGGVAGEKRIYIDNEADASTTGENLYWKYESKLKQLDSELNTTIGAAGELFSIRRKLYETVPSQIILDDFIISMRIAQKGYRILYEPEAYAMETSSVNIKEELKRKIRIAAGGIQSVVTLIKLLNPLKYPMLSFQYVSHRVLRWTITPFLLIIAFLLNAMVIFSTDLWIYYALFAIQILFYFLATFGPLLEKRKLRLKIVFIPYYFCLMNYSIIVGIFRYLKKSQSSVWEKVERKDSLEVSIMVSKQKC